MDATTGASAAPVGPAPAGPATSPSSPTRGASDEPTRFLEFALGTVLLFAWAPARLPGQFGIGLVAAAALVALAAVRRPTRSLGSLSRLPFACVVVLGYLVAVTLSSPDDSLYGWPKRAVRLLLVVVLLLALVQGRVHLPSVVRGAAFGLVANAVAFYAGVAPREYGALLSGFLLDKNQAGLAYTVVGLLLLGVTADRRRQVAIVVALSGFVWLTGSRTSLAALACGLAWFALRNRLGPAGRVGLAAAMAATIPFVEENYARAGVFATRTGSDQFRATIDAASQAKLAQSPLQGRGLGEAWVLYPNGDVFFFHNSFWSAIIEGGYPYLLALLVAHVVLGVRPLRSGPAPSGLARAGEAANIAVLVCALRLGEVFGTTVATLALAAGLIGHIQAARAREDREAPPLLPTAEPTAAVPGRVGTVTR